MHDGYLICMFSCGGPWVGTSASAPSMAGIAALIDEKAGEPQGNLNPALYRIHAADPTAFHDVTAGTSGVSSCSITTASMCNNTLPSPTSVTGGEKGYLVTAGYDEVTGLGSLDVAKFLSFYAIPYPSLTGVAISPSIIPSGGKATVTVVLNGKAPTGGSSIAVQSSRPYLFPLTSPFVIPAGEGSASFTVTAGRVTSATPVILTATRTGVTLKAAATVSAAAFLPTVRVKPSASVVKASSPFSVVVTVVGVTGKPIPSGQVRLNFEEPNFYFWWQYGLTNGSATITVPAGTFSIGGSIVLSASYIPDASSSALYVPATGKSSVYIQAMTTPSVFVTPATSSITTAQSLAVAVRVQGGTGNGTVGDGNGTPAGAVTLSCGSYVSSAVTLNEGSATITIPAGSLPIGTETITATFTPNSTSAKTFNAAKGTATVKVT